jgi:hypothetical protein
MTAYWAPIINKIKAPLEAARLIGEIDENTDVEAVVQMLACTLVIESLVPTFSNKANLIDILISQLRRGLVPGRK